MKTRNQIGFPVRELGLSDATFMAHYVLLNRPDGPQPLSFFAEVGSGISLPTRRYDPHIQDRHLPENFNLGRSALGCLWQLNAAVYGEGAGVVGTGNFQYTRPTRTGYRFGQGWSGQVSGFREVALGRTDLVPNADVGFERLGRDRLASGSMAPETVGRGWLLSAGFNLKTTAWLAGCSYGYPLRQQNAQGAMRSTGRVSCQISIIL
ncbi:MAG: hypothetical protein RLY31_3006 [Bacteroidota bacterium]|jgi:hypothetical protein